jgi:C-terminal processing protease CtpA/Prc
MERVVNNRREYDPFEKLGFNVRYNFITVPKKLGRKFVAEVISVTANTPAGKSDIKKGDLITGINKVPLAGSVNVSSMLSEDLPMLLDLQRDGSEISLRIAEENATVLP